MGRSRAPRHHASVRIDEKRAGYANAAEKVVQGVPGSRNMTQRFFPGCFSLLLALSTTASALAQEEKSDPAKPEVALADQASKRAWENAPGSLP